MSDSEMMVLRLLQRIKQLEAELAAAEAVSVRQAQQIAAMALHNSALESELAAMRQRLGWPPRRPRSA